MARHTRTELVSFLTALYKLKDPITAEQLHIFPWIYLYKPTHELGRVVDIISTTKTTGAGNPALMFTVPLDEIWYLYAMIVARGTATVSSQGWQIVASDGASSILMQNWSAVGDRNNVPSEWGTPIAIGPGCTIHLALSGALDGTYTMNFLVRKEKQI